MPIPKCQIKNQARKHAGFEHAQHEPQRRHTRKAVRGSHTDCNGAPGEHEKCEPPTGPHLLEQNVAGDLEHGVSDDEGQEGNGELVVGHSRRVLHVVARRDVEYFGIANVITVDGEQKAYNRAK